MTGKSWLEPPATKRPTALVISFKGWSDAGEAASMSSSFLRRELRARRVGSISPDDYFDFTVTRPQVRVDGTGVRKITWPESRLYLAESVAGGRDLLLCEGHEPQLRWMAYSSELANVAEAFGVDMVVTLGALLSEVPHTRPVRVFGTSSSETMRTKIEIVPSDYEGPTGVLSVLLERFQEMGIGTCVSLWANVPHYIAQNPSPKAALALVRRVMAVVGFSMETDTLENKSILYEQEIRSLLEESNEDLKSYVEGLEHDADNSVPESEEGLRFTSGDDLAGEVERFLRSQEEK